MENRCDPIGKTSKRVGDHEIERPSPGNEIHRYLSAENDQVLVAIDPTQWVNTSSKASMLLKLMSGRNFFGCGIDGPGNKQKSD